MKPDFYGIIKNAKTAGLGAPDFYSGLFARNSGAAVWPSKTITGVPPIIFKSDGTPLTAWQIDGNMVQDGTPSQYAPIYPAEFGDLIESGEHAGEYAVQITNAGQTQTVYLSEPLRKIDDYVDTFGISIGGANRRIRKMVFDGTEAFYSTSYGHDNVYFILDVGELNTYIGDTIVCSHFQYANISSANNNIGCDVINSSQNQDRLAIRPHNVSTMSENDFKQWVADQYSAGTPLTVWIVRTSPITETITAPTIATVRGSNTLTIGTTLQPSSVSITGHIKQI